MGINIDAGLNAKWTLLTQGESFAGLAAKSNLGSMYSYLEEGISNAR